MNASDGRINPLASRLQPTEATKVASAKAYQNRKVATPNTTVETSNVTHPAASLELSQEGVQLSKQAHAKEQLAAIKEKISVTELDQVHSNLRAMKVNNLIFD